MKKLFALLILAVGFTGSMFAVNFTVGGNLNAGGTISDDSKYHGFSAGTGAFFNMDIFMGLGIQAEVNLSEDYISVDKNTITFDERYGIVDSAVMAWWNAKLGFIGLGAGIGPNFSGTISDYEDDNLVLGLAAGANVIFYLGNHFGLVTGVHGVFDFTPRFSAIRTSPEDKVHTITFESEDWKRRSIYGSFGVEYRF